MTPRRRRLALAAVLAVPLLLGVAVVKRIFGDEAPPDLSDLTAAVERTSLPPAENGYLALRAVARRVSIYDHGAWALAVHRMLGPYPNSSAANRDLVRAPYAEVWADFDAAVKME